MLRARFLFGLSFCFLACSSTPVGEATLITMTFRGEVLDFGTEGDSAGTSELCVRDYDVLSCGTDEGSGFNMEAPAERDLVIEVANANYAPHLLQHRVQAATNFAFPLLSASDISDLEGASGATALGGKGTVLVYVSDGDLGQSGTNVGIAGSGVSGTFFGNLGEPDELLSSTSGNGYVAFVGVDPGTYHVTLSHASELCGSFTRGLNEDGRFEVVVEAGTVTHAGEFECSERITASAGGDGETG